MKVFVHDVDALALGFILKCLGAGHEVRWWIPPDKSGERNEVGDGLVTKVRTWEPSMEWADLILITINDKYVERLDPYFKKGYPIIGANKEAQAWEHDREVGSKIQKAAGVRTLPYKCFTDYGEAISYVKETGESYACKPSGGNADRALSYVSKNPADMTFMMERWKSMGLKADFILQKKVKGVEMGVGGWFGRGGWCEALDENFEHKKLFNDELGCNTGEMGTVMRYVKRSKLFEQVLEPVTPLLEAIDYVGNVDVNCIIDDTGKAWPLEFTMRCGWPSFNLCVSLHQGDPVEWMAGLLDGRDLLRVKYDTVCTGVVMVHGDFPHSKFPTERVSGYPIEGVSLASRRNVWLTHAKLGKAPLMEGGQVVEGETLVTAGDYVCVVTGHGETVEESRAAAYDRAWRISWCSDRAFRTDIGCRLKEQIPLLRAHGYARGLRYE